MRPQTVRYEVRDDGPVPAVGDVLAARRLFLLVVSVRALSRDAAARVFTMQVVTVADPDGARLFTVRWDLRWRSLRPLSANGKRRGVFAAAATTKRRRTRTEP